MAVPSLIVPLSPHYLHRWGHCSALTMVLLTTPTLAGMDSGVKASNNVHMWHSVAFLSIITFWNIHYFVFAVIYMHNFSNFLLTIFHKNI